MSTFYEKYQRKYARSKLGKAARLRHLQSKKGKETARRYLLSKRSKDLRRAWHATQRRECLEGYCEGPPHCMCKGCPVNIVELLDLHHDKGDGTRQRRELGGTGRVYRWLVQHKFPAGYTVLCANCHRARHAKVKCPHPLVKT